jgi:hypothetical protein
MATLAHLTDSSMTIKTAMQPVIHDCRRHKLKITVKMSSLILASMSLIFDLKV